MKIKVVVYFQGHMTDEQIIAPGVYDMNDPALFGCGAYLVERGKAVVLDVIESENPPVVEIVEKPKLKPKPKAKRGRPKKASLVIDENSEGDDNEDS